MLMDVVAALQRVGLSVEVRREQQHGGGARVDGVIDVDVNGVKAAFAVEIKARAPYPNELPNLEDVRCRVAEFGAPMLVSRFISPSVGDRLSQAGWSWADREGNMDLHAPGVLVSRRQTLSPTLTVSSARLPGGAGSAALVRLMIGWPKDCALPATVDLATRVGVSQPRVSQILVTMRALGLAAKENREWHVADRAQLLDRYLDDRVEVVYPTTYWYSLEPMIRVAERAVELNASVLVSADVGPDLVAPWKQPAAVVLYASDHLDVHQLGAVEAESPASANVLVRYTRPAQVAPWPMMVGQAHRDGPEIPLADPSIMLRDMLDLGGDDRVEAAGVLRDWIVNRK